MPPDGAGATGSSTATYGRRETDVSQDDDTKGGSDDQEDFNEVRLEVKQEEIQKMLTCGAVSKNLYDRLDIFTAPRPQFEHVLNPTCKQCSKCTLCMKEGGQTRV